MCELGCSCASAHPPPSRPPTALALNPPSPSLPSPPLCEQCVDRRVHSHRSQPGLHANEWLPLVRWRWHAARGRCGKSVGAREVWERLPCFTLLPTPPSYGAVWRQIRLKDGQTVHSNLHDDASCLQHALRPYFALPALHTPGATAGRSGRLLQPLRGDFLSSAGESQGQGCSFIPPPRPPIPSHPAPTFRCD